MSPTVLVVDDDATLRCILAIALEDSGYRVAEAYDGIQALALLGRCSPDLILTDLRTPRLDGIGLARLLAPHTPPVPLIVMSADPLPPDCSLPFIRKPFEIEALLTLMARTLPVSPVASLALAGLGAI
ncbi:MAG TPA: response regulator [Thermomicrobiales bacterium]|nr:response regulator [Thermomicrobiales bacterium]